MRIFQMLMEKYGKKKEIEDVKATVARFKLVKGELKQREIEKLMDSKIPMQYIIELEYMVEGGAYPTSEYFLCEIPRSSMRNDCSFNAVKVTGSNLGETYLVSAKPSAFNPKLARARLRIDNTSYAGWFKPTDENIYVPPKCKTFKDLHSAVARSNAYKLECCNSKQNNGDLNT